MISFAEKTDLVGHFLDDAQEGVVLMLPAIGADLLRVPSQAVELKHVQVFRGVCDSRGFRRRSCF